VGGVYRLSSLELRLMKITNWTKKLSAAIVAAGIWVPSAALAVNIPLSDSSFESFVVPGSGFAYADTYRVGPTASQWVDDLDNPPGYTQDNAQSHWLYNSNYAETSNALNHRPAPRTGDQAMHGLFNYSAQETAAVFEAGETYTFSIWAQNDELLNDTNGLFMYIFDGNVPFSDANSLASILHTGAIPKRATGMSAAQSQANWALVSVSYTVPGGSPAIGHPVGVGFFARRDTAVDDASLSATPEPASVILVGIGAAGLSLVGRRGKRD
jgi:hypothetical protein